MLENEFDYDNYDASKEFSYLEDKEKKIPKRRKNPVDDTEFTFHILLSKGLGKLTRIAEKNIIILVEEAVKKTYYKFENSEDIKDSIQTAYINILTKWQGFNPEVASSAFTYFTEIQKRSGAEFINEWKRIRGIKKEHSSSIRRVSINSSNNGKGLFNI